MIKISTAFDTTQRLKELIKNLKILSIQENGSEIIIDKIGFATPLSITPLSVFINKKSLLCKYKKDIDGSYLKTICFPEGVNEINKIVYKKTYLPIIHFRLEGLNKEDVTSRLAILHTKYLDLLRLNVIADPNFLDLITNNTFGFLLGELFDNIEEHSEAKNVFLFSQYWPKNNSCELCLIDDGLGLFGSLKKANRDVNNSYDALRKILTAGLSAKTEFGDIKRGTGIKNTRAAIANKDLKGEFFIMSGDVAFLQSAESGEKFFKLTSFFWNGTIIMMRLNRPISKFDLYNYVR